jgi:hypothetical protein
MEIFPWSPDTGYACHVEHEVHVLAGALGDSGISHVSQHGFNAECFQGSAWAARQAAYNIALRDKLLDDILSQESVSASH